MKPLTQVPADGVLVQLYLTYHVAQVFSPQQHSSTGAQPPDSIPNPLLPLSLPSPRPKLLLLLAPPLPRRTGRGDWQRSRTRRRRLLPARGDDDDEYDGDGKKGGALLRGPAMSSTPPPRDLERHDPAAPPTRDLAGLALAAERSRRPRPRHGTHAASSSG
jgi:hypothetical protein